jgi:hypothetical protein
MPKDQDGFSLRTRARLLKFKNGIVRGRDKADEEVVHRDSLSADGTWKERHQRFDHTGDLYEETVTDPETGRVIYRKVEPLSKHRNHGDAKRKKPSTEGQ